MSVGVFRNVQMHGTRQAGLDFRLGIGTTGRFAKHWMSESIGDVLAEIPRIGTGHRGQVDLCAFFLAVDFT